MSNAVVREQFIGGAWRPSAGDARIEVVSPADGRVIGSVPDGVSADIDDAVADARRAATSWASTPVEDRLALITALADAVEERHEEFTQTIVAEVGTPRRLARWAQVNVGIIDLRNAIEAAASFGWEEQLANSLIVRDPVGVVGLITPWNFPLHQVTAKVGPALAAGCTIVLKPSEVAPLTAALLADAAADVGIPAGVLNVVNGAGPVVGAALAGHPDVDMVSFTGSTEAGKRVAALAAGNVKRVALELGGKSASLLLDDLDDEGLENAVKLTMRSSYMNGGQACNALTRLIVPADRVDHCAEVAARVAATYAPGDPTAQETRLGPLVSAAQRDRVLSYIDRGIEDGATLVTGGLEPPAGLDDGYYVQPTVFRDVRPEMAIAQEEIFGPVLSIIAYQDVEEAVEIANGTMYGLAAAVWGEDPDRARHTARRMEAAQVEVNGGAFNPKAPFGGYKQSGLGREGGTFGLEEYLEVKSLQL